MAKTPTDARHNTISIVRFITFPLCSRCMDDDHPDHDISVSVPGNIRLVYLSDFPVSGTFLCFRTWLTSFRCTFVRVNWFMTDRKLSEQFYGIIKFFSVKTVMGIVSILMRSNKTAEMKDSEVLRNCTLRNIEMAGKCIHTEGFVIPKKGNYSKPAFNAKHSHQFSHLLKRMILCFH